MDNTQKTKIISIIGPTASGKTKLAIALSKKIDLEIISADSMQVYQEFDILSAKPSKSDMSKVPHYLVDFLSVTEEFSVANFVELAHKYIKKISENNKIPVLVGGTGLYLDSLVKNINFDNNTKNSEKISELKLLDNINLMKILKNIDIQTAEKLHINDRKRILRALDFYYSTGNLISDQVARSKKSEKIYDVCKIGLNFRDRNLMYDKINSRVESMFDNNIVTEVKNIYNKKISKTAKSAIGFKEILEYINNNLSLEETKDKIKQATRNYAKRQLTWFRRDQNINWIYIDDYENFNNILVKVENIVKDFMKSGEI